MLKAIKGRKKMGATLFNQSIIKLVSLCAVLSLMSSSALALRLTQPIPDTLAQQQTVRNVTVTVRSTGCDPSSTTQTAGQINLQVINQTGAAELFVQFYDGQGNVLREVVIAPGSTQWSETFDLKAGQYTIIAGRNQAWTFHLTVQ